MNPQLEIARGIDKALNDYLEGTKVEELVAELEKPERKVLAEVPDQRLLTAEEAAASIAKHYGDRLNVIIY